MQNNKSNLQNSIQNILNLSLKWNWKNEHEIKLLLNNLSLIIDWKIAKFDKNIKPINKMDFGKNNYNNYAQYIDTIRNHLITKKYDYLVIENKINAFFGLLMPSNDWVNKTFTNNQKKYQQLLKLSKKSYYIKYDKKNPSWEINDSQYGKIKISINRSKPEKTPAQIIAAKNKKVLVSEPKCPICITNIGFCGSSSKPSKENLRVIFLQLLGEKWFFQYSPYGYVKEHFVLNNFKHTKMKIDNKSIAKIVSFVNNNPNYFLGSNADLPIVGGSLLSHDHYQGGRDSLPIMKAASFLKKTEDDCVIKALIWPLSTIKITSQNSEKIIKKTNQIITKWKHFSGEKIINNKNNTVTIIVNKVKKNIVVYLILRNNSTSEKNKFGNYHIKPARFNIKQENIGLMEAAGLAILPKRLETEMLNIKIKLENSLFSQIKQDKTIGKHYNWLKKYQLLKNTTTKDELDLQIGKTFIECLEDCNIFENSKSFKSFFEAI